MNKISKAYLLGRKIEQLSRTGYEGIAQEFEKMFLNGEVSIDDLIKAADLFL